MRFCFGFLLFIVISLQSSLINANDYLLCTSRCSPIDLAFADATTLPSECQDQEDNDDILEPFALCSVEYRINYRYERIHVTFSGLNETEKFDVSRSHQYLEQSVTLNLHSELDETDETTRKYFCNTKKDCAREFYLNTIGSLLYDGKSTLTLIKNKLFNGSLIVGPSSRRRCIDSDKTGAKPSVPCRTGLCYAHYVRHHHHHDNGTKTQKCHEHERPVLISKNEYHITDSATQTQNEFLEYRCNKNVCNRNDMIDIIHGLLSEFSHLNATKGSTSTAETDSTPDSQNIQTKKSSSTSLDASLILVLFYMLLQICF